VRRLWLLLPSALFCIAAALSPERGELGVVASDHVLASEAGAWVLEEGGNAVDAAVAAALAVSVVQPSAAGLGGGGFAVVVDGDERWVLDFREVAPAASHPALFRDDAGEVIDGLSVDGGLAVAVPGEARGLMALHARRGQLPLATVAKPALRYAKRGFPAGHKLAAGLVKRPVMAEALFGLTSAPVQGAMLKRPRLHKALKAFVASKGEAFHTGWVAEDLVAAARAAGGLITLADLADYQPTVREPLVGTYLDHTIITMPPPSSGGAVLLQVLGVLDGYDLDALGHGSSAYDHLLAEAFQHAYADRAAFMGDPAFTDVPVDRMLSPERIEAVRASIHPAHTLDRDDYGSAVSIPEDAGTEHIAVIDASGLTVALTHTVNTGFGSKVVGPRSGVLLNNQMDDFVAKPGVPNTYGLIGREANQVEAGKKPLSSMTPTVVLDPEGVPLMAVGASGGPFIISSTVQAIVNVLSFGMDLAEAVDAPRVHHQWVPELLFVEPLAPIDVRAALEARGHTVRVFEHGSAVQAVMRVDDHFVGAADPRKDGRAAGARSF